MTKAIVEARKLVKMTAATPSQKQASKLLFRAKSEEQWVALMTSPKEDIRLRALMYMEDRKAGKPFVETNPNASGKKMPATDPRLTDAIGKYLPGGSLGASPTPETDPKKIM